MKRPKILISKEEDKMLVLVVCTTPLQALHLFTHTMTPAEVRPYLQKRRVQRADIDLDVLEKKEDIMFKFTFKEDHKVKWSLLDYIEDLFHEAKPLFN